MQRDSAGQAQDYPDGPRALWGGADGDPLGAELRNARILLVDDEPANLSLLRRALNRAGYTRLSETTDPLQVARLYTEFQPDLICLDLHMEPLDGLGVLRALGELVPRDTYFPILMLTGDPSVESRQQALALGAKDFVTKPFDVPEVLLRIQNLLIPRFLHLRLRDQNQFLEVRVLARTRALEEARLEVLDRLGRAAEYRDDNTGEHVKRVGRIAGLLADALGLDAITVELIERAAPLHDIGKIGIPDQVLLKPAPLTPDEFETMKRHTTIGARILAGGSSAIMRMAEEIAWHHHERWDGAGYPEGRAGEAIPVAARIVGLADAFDALSHDRPYRPAWPLPKVVDWLRDNTGSHFDPRLMQAFLELPHPRLV
jgi:putative two-component system response regulator